MHDDHDTLPEPVTFEVQVTDKRRGETFIVTKQARSRREAMDKAREEGHQVSDAWKKAPPPKKIFHADVLADPGRAAEVERGMNLVARVDAATVADRVRRIDAAEARLGRYWKRRNRAGLITLVAIVGGFALLCLLAFIVRR